MTHKHYRTVSSLIVLLFYIVSNARTIYIKNYDIGNCSSEIEKYNTLFNAHQIAVRSNSAISYEGIRSIELEITDKSRSIPLPEAVDFAGVEIVVKNQVKDFFLFTRQLPSHQVDISANQISAYDFRNIPFLKSSLKLLLIEDIVPWVEKRHGYSYGAIRKDILLVDNGVSQNKTIAPYCQDDRVKCEIVDVSNRQKKYTNLSFTRTENSTFKTFLFKLEKDNNVILSNISITTPPSNLYGDGAITINNCTNVKINSVTIDGTYSQQGNFGYGFFMNNVWNSDFSNLDADGNWGVFGTNNMNFVTIRDSKINRFDIHCYGRDVRCFRTTFNGRYNCFSSLYGTLEFDKCTFNNFLPVILGDSYYSYTPFDIVIRDCCFYVDHKRPFIIYANFIDSRQYRIREELRTPHLPNVSIDNLKVYIPHNKQLYLFDFRGTYLPSFTNNQKIKLKNITFFSETLNVELLLANKYNNLFDARYTSIETPRQTLYFNKD